MPRRCLPRLLVVVAALTASSVEPIHAQLISPKTVPIAQGNQFDIFPSSNAGLSGVSIALDDSLADLWSNPARASRVGASRFFSTPTFYSISEESGSGRTLPMGMAGSFGKWSAGGVVALQQVDKGLRQQWSTARVSDRSAINQFASAALSRRFDDAGLSVGASVFGASLDAVDGVDLLYGSADRVEQSGGLADVRFGLTKTWTDTRALDVVLVYDRFDMTHDAMSTVWTYPAPTAPPVPRDSFYVPWPQPVSHDTVAHNQDRTVTWGAHAEFSRPLTTTGWRIGWLGTFNKIEHPKIPNYDIMSVPRDPGSTRAINLGVGLSRMKGPTTFGVDVIYEPMWSDTWADAARDTAITGGGTIKAGQKTIENDFTFSNALVRMGVGRDMDFGTARDSRTLGLQLGVSMHTIDYRLRQRDNVRRTYRTQNEDWVEWTPTIGVSLRFSDLELRYTGRRTLGVDRPGGSSNVVWAAEASGAPKADGIIVAPSAPLVMSPVHVVSHSLSIAIPIR